MGRALGRVGREPGGIVGLVGLIGEHQAEFEYDWRSRFQLPLSVVGESMSWPESVRLTRLLGKDSSSQVGAAVGGLVHPVSIEAALIADFHDLTLRVNTDPKKQSSAKPRPRSWIPKVRKFARPEVDQATVIAALREAGHTAPLAAG